MRRRSVPLFAAAVSFAAAIPTGAVAQVRASERATVSQTVDGTVITIEYSRPVARGRELFGGVVRWGRSWTPGANWATTFAVSRDVTLNGQRVTAGTYSMWMVPAQEEWTVFLSARSRVFHTQTQKPDDAAVRFAVRPEQAPHMEALAFYFPEVRRDGASLRMHWGTTAVPMEVGVTPSRPAVMTEAQAAPYVGKWTVEFDGEGASPGTSALDIAFDGSRLFMRFAGDTRTDSGYALTLLPDGRFRPVMYDRGTVVDVDEEAVLAFTMEGGVAVSFELRQEGAGTPGADNGGVVVTGRGKRIR